MFIFDHYLLQWVPEISHHCQKTPFLLVGTQIDLRDDAGTIEKLAKNKQKPLTQVNTDNFQYTILNGLRLVIDSVLN